jgi:ketosteroid isomerase-like protein
VVVVAIACFALAGPVRAQPPAETGDRIRPELEGRVADLLDAYRRKDPLGIARIFAADATISGPAGLRVRGREAIDRYWQARSLAAAWTIETHEVGGSQDAPWQVARSIRVSTAAGRTDTTRTDFLLVWKRGADGALRIYYDIFN